MTLPEEPSARSQQSGPSSPVQAVPSKVRPVSPLRSLLGPAIATLLLFPLLVGLGWWQLDRLRWKEDLIAKVEQRVHQPAVPAPAEAAWGQVTFTNDEYRRVTATGHFLNDLEVQVYALVDETPDGGGGPGYWVVTPLALADGATILVNRGFVPLGSKAPASRPQGRLDGAVTVTGLLRMPETAGPFTPANDPSRDAWYTRDPAAIAVAQGLVRVAPFLIDADAAPVPGGLPVGGLTRVTFPNRHLEYALTWFGLAATLLVFFVVFAAMRLREQR